MLRLGCGCYRHRLVSGQALLDLSPVQSFLEHACRPQTEEDPLRQLLGDKCMAERISRSMSYDLNLKEHARKPHTKVDAITYLVRKVAAPRWTSKAEKLWAAARTLCNDGYLTQRECKSQPSISRLDWQCTRG